jgi:hypothetical protein
MLIKEGVQISGGWPIYSSLLLILDSSSWAGLAAGFGTIMGCWHQDLTLHSCPLQRCVLQSRGHFVLATFMHVQASTSHQLVCLMKQHCKRCWEAGERRAESKWKAAAQSN